VANLNIALQIAANDQASGPLRTITNALGGLKDGALSVGSAVVTGGLSLLVSGAVAAAAALVGIGTAAFQAGTMVDGAMDSIVIATGATGDELEGLEDSFGTVFSSVPTDAGTAAAVVATLNQRLGITGDTLDDLAVPLAQVTEMIGGDVTTRTELLTRVMGDWNIANEDGAATLDTLFVASQTTGAGLDTLMQQVVQFGSPLRLMGFSLEESIALFAKWEQEGVNAELVMGSLRIAAGEFANANIPLRDGLMQTMDAIMGAKDESEALAIAMDVFGARAGPDMAAAILEGRFAIEDLLAVMEDSEGAIGATMAATADFGESWTMAKNRIMLALEPIGARMIGLANDVMPLIVGVIEQRVIPAIDTAAGVIESFFGNMEAGQGPVDALIVALDGIAPQGFLDFLATMRDELPGVIANIGQFAGEVQTWMVGTALPALREFSEWFRSDALPVIQEFAGQAQAWIVGTLIPAVTQFSTWVSENREPIMAVLGGIVAGLAAFSVVTTVVGWITGLIAAVGAMGTAITAAGGIVATIVGVLGGPLTIVIAAVAAAIGLLVVAWNQNWGDIQGKTQAAVDFIQNVISTALAAIQAWWGEHGDTVIAVVTGYISTVQSVVQTAINFIQTVIQGALTAIRGWWAEHGDAVMGIVNNLFNFVRTTIDNALQFVTSIWQAFQAAREGDWTAFGEHLRGAWDAVWSQVQNVMDSARTHLALVFGEIIETALGWFRSLREQGPGIVLQAVDAIKGVFQNTDWGALGTSLLQGIANGITAATGFIVNAVNSALQAAWDAAAGFIQPGSPSRNPAIIGLGSSFVQGIGVGAASEEEALRQALVRPLQLSLGDLSHLVGGNGKSGATTARQSVTVQLPADAGARSVNFYNATIMTGSGDNFLEEMWRLAQ
jgi:phage-related protein